MPKINKGRLSGFDGMDRYTYEELYAWADELEAKIDDVKNTDDPKYLMRWAKKLRVLANQKERAVEHKDNQNKYSSEADQ